MMGALIPLISFAVTLSQHQVTELPGWAGPLPWTMYTGYLPVWPECDGNLFYWFTERDGGSTPDTPLLIWLNGGPGASSLYGFFVENIGPLKIYDTTLITNNYTWTDKYNILIVDNPVGTGFSNTTDVPECYVRTLFKVAEQFYTGLKVFRQRHPKYFDGPLWLTGESYAATYIPFIAHYFHIANFPFTGVILGNGNYDPVPDILTVPVRFFQEGLLDEHGNAEVTKIAQECAFKMDPVLNATDMFSTCKKVMDVACSLAGGVFQYDLRVFTSSWPADTWLINYMSREDVKAAIQTTGNTWTSGDEEGPVADALAGEFGTSVMGLLVELLDSNYAVVSYNGIADGSSWNHLGNSQALLNLEWRGQAGYAATKQSPWRLSETNFLGFSRVHQNLAYVTLQNAGHLVPINQPGNFRLVLDEAISGKIFHRR